MPETIPLETVRAALAKVKAYASEPGARGSGELARIRTHAWKAAVDEVAEELGIK